MLYLFIFDFIFDFQDIVTGDTKAKMSIYLILSGTQGFVR